MFNSIFGKRPSIPVRIPNDDSTFNPTEYPNVIFAATGKLSGKVRLVHGGEETDATGLGLISTRIWVVTESDQEKVVIKPTFDKKTHVFKLEGPENYTDNHIYHETMIQYPRSISSVDSLSVEAPNVSFSGDSLQSLFFASIKSTLSNGSVALGGAHADVVCLHTTNASISGTYDAGHIDFLTLNGSISGKINVRNALDGNQSKVSIKTTNGSMDLHVTATETARGLWMENISTNGRITVGTLLGKADRASFINASTTNGKIDFNLDASRSGQPLEFQSRSSNAGIISSVMVPIGQAFKGVAETSNGSVDVNLTEDFHGKFEVETRNSSTTVEGSELNFEQDKKTSKRGYRGQREPSEFKIRSTNASASLRFFPSGRSMAADYQDMDMKY
ncbi:hypothetical protein BGX21_005598 [Mortierella sp. AD011]|nr:hypothetical protein BGX20_001299 [Mortierella sp. AD010]KAF9399802.1 hypothetical protein BGX21_005598 [Mortierella sp. AD011]